jgi:aspartyl-tRNA(Asn)/glutamyl-tRNA(Gln) amidotransferase subunit A
MPDPALHRYTARELLDAFRRGAVTPAEAAHAYLGRIDELDGRLRAFVTVDHRQVLADAEAATARYGARTARPLEGLPIAVKDLIDTRGLRTTYGSAMFGQHVPARDASVVTALSEAGAIVLGKTTTHEFAWGITTDGSAYGPTRNPWDHARSAGGSSGGSAVALAGRLAPLALGTDTVGSVRIPAAFCGIVGFKPTFGTIDRAGVFPLAVSLDHIGVMARNVADVRVVWETLTSPCSGAPAEWTLDRMRVGLAMRDSRGPARLAVSRLSARLADLGIDSGECPIPPGDDVLALAGTIVAAEGLGVHTRQRLWPGRRAEYERDVAARLESAERVTAEQHAAAQVARADLRQAMNETFEQWDVLGSPVSLAQPIRIDEAAGERLARFRRDAMSQTALASLIGAPALTVPTGPDRDGLPVGVQLLAAPGNDSLLLHLAERLSPADADEPPDF